MNDLDRRAALVLGTPVDDWEYMHTGVFGHAFRHECHTHSVPRYSTDMNAAMELVERAFKEGGHCLHLTRLEDGIYHAAFTDRSVIEPGRAASIPATAITLAFLELYESGKLGEKK